MCDHNYIRQLQLQQEQAELFNAVKQMMKTARIIVPILPALGVIINEPYKSQIYKMLRLQKEDSP